MGYFCYIQSSSKLVFAVEEHDADLLLDLGVV